MVVGEFLDASGDFHGFAEARGVFTPVDDPAGPRARLAGINNLGVMVGFYVDSSGNLHGFELTPPANRTLPRAGCRPDSMSHSACNSQMNGPFRR